MKEKLQKFTQQFANLITLLGEIVGLVIAIRANAHIWIVLFGFSAFVTASYGLIYILSTKKLGLLSLDGKQRKMHAYPDIQRRWAFAGLIVIMMLFSGTLTYPSGRTYIREAFRGTATPSLGELASCPIVKDGETLILLAQFENINPSIGSYAVNETLIRALRGSLDEFPNVVFHPINMSIKEIQGSEHARILGKDCNADLLIWGWYRMSSADSLDEVIVHIETFMDQSYFTPSSSYELQATIVQLDSFQLRLDLTQQLTAFSLFITGLTSLEQDNYNQAIPAFTQALEIDAWVTDHNYNSLPNNSDTLGKEILFYYRGYANQQYKKYEQAISDYSDAIAINSTFYQAYNNRGAIYDNYIKDYEKAIADYNQAIALDSNQSFAYYTNRGDSYRKLGNYEQAMADYDQAITINPEYELIYNSRGITFHDLGDDKKAIADYNKAITINTKFAVAYYNRGNAYYSLGDYEQAITDFTQALTLDTEFSFIYYEMRGRAYSNLRNYEQAIADYNQSIAVNSEYSETYKSRGDTYAYMGEYKQAISDYTKAITLNPKYAMAYNNRGNVFSELGDTEQAIADYNEAISVAPQFALAYENLGSMYFEEENYEQAIINYTQAINIHPEYASVYIVRGFAYIEIKNYEQAIADFEKLTQLQPSSANAWNYLCWGGSLSGKADEVLDACEQAVNLADSKSLPSVTDSRGLARALTGDYEGAIKDFQFYVDSKDVCDGSCAMRKEWIEMLKEGINPFDEKMLEYLLNE